MGDLEGGEDMRFMVEYYQNGFYTLIITLGAGIPIENEHEMHKIFHRVISGLSESNYSINIFRYKEMK